jgi:adenylyltransferase/sulfurtransferase
VDLGRPKVESAAATLGRTAPWLRVRQLPLRLSEDNAAEILAGWQVVIEGSDSIATKFLVSDRAVSLGIPAVIGGVVRFSGQVMTVVRGAACYRCLFEEPPQEAPPSCQQAGVLGPSCGVVGALQASEALRILSGCPPRYAGGVLTIDLLAGRFRTVPVSPRPGCPACGISNPRRP